MSHDYAQEAAEQLTRELTNEERLARMRTWLQDHPHRPSPYDVVVQPNHVSVWAIIGNIQASRGDLCEVAEGYEIPLDAVRAALAYYTRYPEIIRARIDANEGISYLETLV